ncbi:hypothetical protein GCM10023187_34030 [Nibrella viscosa]|uniref:Uncharacterized protein n=1 Tax=Nibrella viscosa TaxID=1084524 RepID=A0ABP8KM08_9BACT
MYLLTDHQLDTLRSHLRQSAISPDLLPELTDHLACDLEEAMWAGMSFDEALPKILKEASLDTLSQLQEDYCSILGLEPESEPATLRDIVFMNRNKLYGAYDLREHYTVATEQALLWGIVIFSVTVMALGLHVSRQVQRERSKTPVRSIYNQPIFPQKTGSLAIKPG